MTQTKTQLIVLLGVLFISFSSIFVRLSDAPSLIIAFYRMLFTTVLLLPFFLKDHVEKKVQATSKNLSLSILSGIFLALHFYVFMESLNYTSVTSSTVLVTIHPIFVGFGSYFVLKEKVNKGFLKAVLLTLLGGIIISISDAGQSSSALYGDFLAFTGAIYMTLYMLIGRVVRQHLSLTTYTFTVYLTSAVTLFALNLIAQKPLHPYDWQEWLIFFAMAFICTILGHNILNWALKHINPTFISTSILGEPVFATIWAMLLFVEYPGIYQLIGSAVVILGLSLLIRQTQTAKI